MTTIAYKWPMIAADTQMTIDDVKFESDDKIAILNEETVLAAAGCTASIKALERFFRSPNWEEKLERNEKPDVKKDVEAILVFRGKVYIVDRDVEPMPLVHPFYACGSGWQFAMAALHTGLSPVDAVLFASEFDVYTNNRVRCLNVQEFIANSKTKPRRGKRTKEVEAVQETD